MMIGDEEDADWGRESRLKKSWDGKFGRNWTINGFEKEEKLKIRDLRKEPTQIQMMLSGSNFKWLGW